MRDNGYVVEAFDEEGKMAETWINTDITEVSIENISKLDLRSYVIILKIRGVVNSRRSNRAIVELSRYHYLTDGVFNEERQCYYPKETNTNKGIEDYNRLEKFFKKWGFNSL